MPITFAKAPLVELIAELRWIPQGSTPVPTPAPQGSILPTVFLGGPKQEEFYMRLGAELYKSGFNRSERVMPAGLPFMLHQPVYRFRSEAEDKKSVLYQVGYGVFSVHGIPPYRSWNTFLPFVETGIGALLQSRVDDDAARPFVQANLRYIDFFGEDMTRGRDIPSFMSEVFGLSLGLPAAITQFATSREVTSLLTKVTLPIGIGELTVSVGDGKFNNQSGILLDNTVSSKGETAPRMDGIMEMFNSAYRVIHHMFFELTQPLHGLMEPQGADDK